ncbi:hypothetical protein NWP21_11180 [Anabaenopsis sp. FSS-46]|uniref:hypothetical protein n=1 Tax=Anabaenopsis sp. FSS-46 TaxID=2971766 RepID=UPI002476A676|nr:hypothetical protein [Anabaenopsis sp. FSS-46]MDH6099390.1 hypothetical protein [Anabaenopsis sp. FSS-46]
MRLKQQKSGALSILSAEKRKVWILAVMIATTLLLSSCSGTKDYETDLGDPSLYKELYTNTKREKESLKRELDQAQNELKNCEINYAALKSKKEGDMVLWEREKAVEERAKRVTEREVQVQEDEEMVRNAKSKIFDNSIEIGQKIGQLDKDEKRIKELSEELEISHNHQDFLMFIIVILTVFVFVWLAYLFFDKYGVFPAVKNDRSKSNLGIIDASVIGDDAEALKRGIEPKSQALLAEKTKDK